MRSVERAFLDFSSHSQSLTSKNSTCSWTGASLDCINVVPGYSPF